MRKTLLFFFLLATSVLSLCVILIGKSQNRAEQTRGPKKRALLIGISKYDRGNSLKDWWDLHAETDVDELAEILRSDRFGFDEVRVLKTPAETTHRSIVDTFRKWLIASTNTGDIVYFHYSGHGHQAPDTNTPDNPIVGDELSGLDDTLVPSDYVSQDDPSMDIRDDEVGILLGELRQRHPSQVFVSFDSCFSGHITRGTKGGGRLVVRGKAWDGPKPTPVPGPRYVKSFGGFLTREQATSQGYVVLSATRDNQLASETPAELGPTMGMFTHALVGALYQAGPSTTYRDIFEKVNAFIASQPVDQNPQLEGSQLDNVLFSGKVRPPAPYIPIDVSSGNLLILAGSLQNVTKGSRYAVFKAGSDVSHEQPLAKATVSDVSLTHATLSLDREDGTKAVSVQSFAAGRAKETEHSYGDNLLRVDITKLRLRTTETDFLQRLSSLPLLQVVQNARAGWDVRVCPDDCGNGDEIAHTSDSKSNSQFTIQRADGTVLAQVPDNSQAFDYTASLLERESRWQFVNKLSNSTTSMKVELRIVPVEVKPASPCGVVPNSAAIIRDMPVDQSEAKLRLSPCDYVQLEVRYSRRNESAPQHAWISVLDLQKNGNIGPLWPDPRSARAQDNHVPDDGNWHRIPYPYVFKIDEPTGRETYKLIATSDPTDFSSVVDPSAHRGPRNASEQKATNSPLGQLLRAVAQGKRSSPAGILPADWSSTSVEFEVVAQK